jgi:hypothetical protein
MPTGDILNFAAWWPKYYLRDRLSLEIQGRDTYKCGKITFQPMNFMHFEYSTPVSYSGGPRFQISARRPAIFIEVFHDFPQSLQANAGIVPKTRQLQPDPSFCAVHRPYDEPT